MIRLLWFVEKCELYLRSFAKLRMTNPRQAELDSASDLIHTYSHKDSEINSG